MTRSNSTANQGRVTDNPEQWRRQFPLIDKGQLAYLDNAATTQKPTAVIDALQHWYLHQNANVHRGVYGLADAATLYYQQARERLQRFINADCSEEVVFVRGATEAINLVAQTYAAPRLQSGDNIVITAMEHHANLLPWQQICAQAGAELRLIPINDEGELQLDTVDQLLDPKRTRMLALTHVSNALGTINPINELIELAHARGVPVLIDGAQAVAHQAVDVQALDCDFYVFSGHKLYGPSGTGVLYGKRVLLDGMQPYQYGGNMVRSVTVAEARYSELPHKFEAGTPNIEGAIGLAAAVGVIEGIGLEAIAAHESELLHYFEQQARNIDGLRLFSNAAQRTGVCSFEVTGIHAHDLATIASQYDVAIRAGHHCAMPLMQRLGVTATARLSLACYNNFDDLDRLIAVIHQARRILL